jgi:hypothetical protein
MAAGSLRPSPPPDDVRGGPSEIAIRSHRREPILSSCSASDKEALRASVPPGIYHTPPPAPTVRWRRLLGAASGGFVLGLLVGKYLL